MSDNIFSENKKVSFYQWDLNQRLICNVTPETEIHFANSVHDNALVVHAYEENGKVYANIPNVFLQHDSGFVVYCYVANGEEKHTTKMHRYNVIPRKRPENYVYTETEVLRWEAVSAAALAAVQDVIDELRHGIAEGDFKGTPGKSAYESALDGGYTGTEEEFNTRLATGGAQDVGLSVVDGCVVVTIEGVLDETFQNSENLLDEKNIIQNSWINYQGELVQNSNYFHCSPILLKKGDYLYNIKGVQFGGGNVFYFSTDSNESSRTRLSAQKIGTDYKQRDVMYFTLSEDTYIQINGYGDTDVMLLHGNKLDDFPTEYIPYNVKNTQSLQTVFINLEKNPLYGKKISFEGDSICYGAGFLGGYGKIISERNNMDYTNTAVGGGTLATGTMSDETHQRHWIVDGLSLLPQDSDYVIFEGGVNDYSLNVALGTMVEDEYDSVFDTTTVLGALEQCCRILTTTFKEKKTGFIFVHRIFGTVGWASTWASEYKPAMIKVLKKWGIPYLDLEETIPPLCRIAQMKELYTMNGDGWHPNELGYKKYYVDKIEAWLKTL